MALIVLYSFAGGFLAVVWTDAMQALLMISTLIVLPGLLLVQVLSDPSLSIMVTLEVSGTGVPRGSVEKAGSATLLLLGTNLSWFFVTLGGYPHLDAWLMAVRNASDRGTAIVVSSMWGILTAIGSVLLGLLALTLHRSPSMF